MAFDLHAYIEKATDMIAAGLLSVFGGTAAYIYKTVKDDTGFKFGPFFVNSFLAFFIGNVIGGFIPSNASYRDGLLMLAGFSTWPILGVLEFYGKKAVLKYIDKVIGVDTQGIDKEIQFAEAREAKAAKEKKQYVSEIPPPVRRPRRD